MDNDNIFKKLKELEVPVDEKGWQAIVNDKRLVRKFSHGKRVAKIVASAAVASLVVGTIFFVAVSRNNNSQPSTSAQSKTEIISAQQQTSAELSNSETPQNQKSRKQSSFSDSDFQQPANQNIAKTAEKPYLPEIALVDPANDCGENDRPSTNTANHTTLHTISKPTISQPKVELHNIQIKNDNSEEEAHISDIKNDNSENEDYTEERPEFFIPSAFTPNGDGLNDVFYVKANFEPTHYDLTIMNRGGDVVFRAKNINVGWDGKTDGKVLPQGMYIYVINYKFKNDKEQKQQGQVLLLP